MHSKNTFRFITIILLMLPFVGWSQDPKIPASPVLNRVSVNPSTGRAYLEWELSESLNVDAYIVYIDVNDAWIAIDTIWDNTATTYVNAASNAAFYSESYVIAAYVDSTVSGLLSPLTDSHSTIFTSLFFNECHSRIELDWTPYKGWDNKLEDYEIIISINGGADSLLVTRDTAQTDYIHQEIQAYTSYSYTIRATRQDGLASTSNRDTVYTLMPRLPAFIHADFASVVSPNQIDLSFTLDPESETKSYRLLKDSVSDTPDETIASYDNYTSSNILHTDHVPDPERRYYYQLAAVNECDVIVKRSNLASNMILRVKNDELMNHLSWTSYRSWENGVDSYKIYRLTGDLPPELIFTQPGNDTTFSDNITELQYSVPGGSFCYYIEATEKPGNQAGVTGISKSNVACGTIPVNLFLPNAFTPNSDGMNDIFRPELSFTPDDYLLIIQDRWGNALFESEDPWEGWDGTAKGDNPVPEGTYLYYLRITASDGEIFEKNGHVSVIFPR